MSMPLTPLDSIEPIRISEMMARIAVSVSMLTWLVVVLALFWR
jgi:hypothetical protein